MITVIIPALNEQRTIGNVVRYCYAQPWVSEVIVIDDNSNDETEKEAKLAGAAVITSRMEGKGMSMKEGIEYATNEILVFLDGDIDPYPEQTVTLLTEPILRGEYDFVKGTFSRNAGRVTELVAKPLLSILYPELAAFSQPLSGMIAGRKELFNRIDFFYDYGVDIGILIDMYDMRARIQEVNIGYIQNKSKPWHSLVKMSREVAGAILQKALVNKVNAILPGELNPINSEINSNNYAKTG
jgi:glucosyl-3-phosphoglycerate synthase